MSGRRNRKSYPRRVQLSGWILFLTVSFASREAQTWPETPIEGAYLLDAALPHATERSPETWSIGLDAQPLHINVTFRWVHTNEDLRERQLSFMIRNTATVPVRALSIQVTGLNARCQALAPESFLSPDATVQRETQCVLIRHGFRTERQWDLNTPLQLSVDLMLNTEHLTFTLPVGYLRYYGWATSNDVGEATLLMLAMTRGGQGMHAQIEEIRRDARGLLGRAWDGSADARLATIEAITRFVRRARLLYRLGGDSYHGHWPSTQTTNFAAETITFGGGACDDFAVLGGHILRRLGIPFAVIATVMHVANLIEIARVRANDTRPILPAAVINNAIELPCQHDRCIYLPMDLSLVARHREGNDVVIASMQLWRETLRTPHGFILVSSEDPERRVPVGTLLGQTWLGADSRVRVETTAVTRPSTQVQQGTL